MNYNVQQTAGLGSVGLEGLAMVMGAAVLGAAAVAATIAYYTTPKKAGHRSFMRAGVTFAAVPAAWFAWTAVSANRSQARYKSCLDAVKAKNPHYTQRDLDSCLSVL